jgi:hypothetical protein
MSNFPRPPKPATGWPKLPEVIAPAKVTFLGEQSEPRDDDYKRMMSRLFSQATPVFRRTYLARLTYNDSSEVAVVLCTRQVEHIEHELKRRSSHMFGEIHRTGTFYDMMIIDEAQEQALKRVCKPFYELS